MRRGFDEFYGTLANTPYFHPTQFVDSRVSPDVQEVEDDAFYTTDAYAARAVDWLGKHKDTPWFLYVPFNAQHAPLQAPQKYLDRFPHIADEKRRLFAAMMSAMDDAVGRILGKVRELGQEKDTLIVFLSDNGGPTRSTTSSNGPLRGFKATTWEGGVRVPFCMQWTGTIPAGTTYEHPIIQLDILPTALAAAGVKADPAWKLDGVDLMPYLTGKQRASRTRRSTGGSASSGPSATATGSSSWPMAAAVPWRRWTTCCRAVAGRWTSLVAPAATPGG
jgi:arylsulfatase A-like enzyme